MERVARARRPHAVHHGVEALAELFVAAAEEEAPLAVGHGVEGFSRFRVFHAARGEALVRHLHDAVQAVAEGLAPVAALVVQILPVRPAGVAAAHGRRERIPSAGGHGEVVRRVPAVFLPGVFLEDAADPARVHLIRPGAPRGVRPRASRLSRCGTPRRGFLLHR